MSLSRGERAIVLVSGGLDSLVTLAIAHQKHSYLAALHLNYGQKTEERELQCFQQMADHYQIPLPQRKVVDIGFLREVGGSSLTDDEMAVCPYEGESEEVPTSYVPFRNTHIIALAVSWAEVIGVHKIYIGAVSEDSSGYPDCRPGYYKAMNALIKEGTKEGAIQVVTPIIALSKKEIVLKGMSLKAPLHLSWSCYQENDQACGVCDSCALRLRGFQMAGLDDPISYRQRPCYLENPHS